MNIFPPLLSDFYKVSHKNQYPVGTEVIYSNLTARSSRLEGVNKVVFFGLQYFIKEYLQTQFNNNFFHLSYPQIVKELEKYKDRLNNALGGCHDVMHWYDLWKLGYLPLEIKALPEGELVPLRVPLLTVKNTLPEFFWFGQWVETLLSNVIWKPITTATIAHQYKKLLNEYIDETSDITNFAEIQGHDFSFRGMSAVDDAAAGGAGHLLSFTGTDTIHSIDFLEQYYCCDASKEVIGQSVAATEHSVMTLNGEEGEFDTIKRLITEVYPTGIVSIVSDSYNLWRVLTDYLPRLKNEILSRDGKVVVRPDSGNPVDIICGRSPKFLGMDCYHPKDDGVIKLLYHIFGGSVNSKRYIQLNPKVGAIYGDSITLDRCKAICEGLKSNGYASTNMVFGIGSYCVSPETPILCSDLTWCKAGNIKVGTEIIAFDENPTFGDGKKASRRYKKAIIETNEIALKNCYKIYTDIGDPIIASVDHPWLVWQNRNKDNLYLDGIERNRKDYPRGKGLSWKTSFNLEEGDKIAFLSKPWEVESSRIGGWLAGIFDGEGSLSYQSKDRSIPAWKVNASQNEGPVLDAIRLELSNRDFDFYENKRKCPQVILKGGWTEFLRFLGTIRPSRLISKMNLIVDSMPALKRDYTYQLATINKIEYIGLHEVSSIRTSSGTFITGGYLSHNTYQYVTRDTFGLAFKATSAKVNGEWKVVYKDPITDNGMKRSARGLLAVIPDVYTGEYTLHENVSEELEGSSWNCLRPVFLNGQLLNDQTLGEIRSRLNRQRTGVYNV